MRRPPTLEVEGISGSVLFINGTSCLLYLRTRSLAESSLSTLRFKSSSFSHCALHLAVTETEGERRGGCLAGKVWRGTCGCRDCHKKKKKKKTPLCLGNMQEPEGSAEMTCFRSCRLIFNVTRACGRGHPSARALRSPGNKHRDEVHS